MDKYGTHTSEELREIFTQFHKRYSETQESNEVKDFEFWMLHELHMLWRYDARIDVTEFGKLMDMVICH